METLEKDKRKYAGRGPKVPESAPPCPQESCTGKCKRNGTRKTFTGETVQKWVCGTCKKSVPENLVWKGGVWVEEDRPRPGRPSGKG